MSINDFMGVYHLHYASGKLISFLFLCPPEATLFLWHGVSVQHASTDVQHGLSIILLLADLVQSHSAYFADGFTIPTIHIQIDRHFGQLIRLFKAELDVEQIKI